MIEIKDSPIHGVGVFATQFIPKGTHITKYNDARVFKDTELTDKDQVTRLELDYVFRAADGKVLVPDYKLRDVSQCGQLINDAANVDAIPNDTVIEPHLKSIIRYYKSPYNAALNENIRALKDIQPGEEILTLYGYGYWATRATKRLELPWEILYITNLFKEHDIVNIVAEMKNEDDIIAFIKCCLAYGRELKPPSPKNKPPSTLRVEVVPAS